MTRIEIHVDTLVLHGVSLSDRRSIAEAFERELTRLFVDQGVPAWLEQPAALDRLDGGSADASRGEALGVHLAQVVYGGPRP